MEQNQEKCFIIMKTMNEVEKKNISQILKEIMQQKGISPEKLGELTGVHINIILHILNGEFSKLPAAPYVRGYIKKISKVLELNGDKVWEKFSKNEKELKKSGNKDILPQTKCVSNKNKIILSLLFLAILIFLFVLSSLSNRPELNLNLDKNLSTTTDSKIVIKGKLKNGDKLLLNGKFVNLNENGEFSEEIVLQPGFNTFIFEASKFLGKEIKEIRQVYYEAEKNNNLNLKENNTSSETNQ